MRTRKQLYRGKEHPAAPELLPGDQYCGQAQSDRKQHEEHQAADAPEVSSDFELRALRIGLDGPGAARAEGPA